MQLAFGEKVKQDDRRGSRVLCDNCGAGIADMYRCCNSCGVDVCLRCCAERRAATGDVRSPVLAACCSPCSIRPSYSGPAPLQQGLRHARSPVPAICYSGGLHACSAAARRVKQDNLEAWGIWLQDVVMCPAGHEFKLARFLRKTSLAALEEAVKVRGHALPPRLGVSLRAVRQTEGSACLMATV